MGKGALKKNASVAAEQGAISLVNPSGRLSFVYNGEVNLAPLRQMNLNGVTLVFNGKFDQRTLEHLDFSGATVYFNGSQGNTSTGSADKASQLRSLTMPNNAGLKAPEAASNSNQTPRRNANTDRVAHITHSNYGLHSQNQRASKMSVPQTSNRSHYNVFENGQLKVKTGGNQEPLGPNQRVFERPIATQKDSVGVESSSRIPESPLADPTYLHPSRMQQLTNQPQHPPSEEGEIPDSASVSKSSHTLRMSNSRDESVPRAGCAVSDDWIHDRYSDSERMNAAQKRSPSTTADVVVAKKPKLSVSESKLNDQANRLAAKELAMRMQLRARNVSNPEAITVETERIRAVSQQRAELQEQMIHQQSIDEPFTLRTSTEIARNDCAENISPSQRGSLRVDRQNLPRSSPLSNIGRLAQVQEDIVQTKVQCALAGKEVQQEQKTWGVLSDATAQKCKEKDHALKELFNKRDGIKNDQQKLEMFNKEIQLPIIKKEKREDSPIGSIRDVPPFDKEENIEPTPAPERSHQQQGPQRSVRFNLTDVETLIDSVKHQP